MGTALDLAPHAGSDDCFSFIQERIDDCIENHHLSCSQLSVPELPKRVIRIDPSGHLLLREPDSERARYAALSYCWGNTENIKTTTTTLCQFQKAIDFDSLPQMFQDAVTITRRLKIEYLWIDSLCIIQNDRIDWETESAKMGSYYRNAYVTIAAESCPNPYMSFLAQRTYGATADFRFSSNTEGRTTVQARACGTRQRPDFEDLGPLADRGWGFQEAVLSTRLLSYTERGILWQCRGGELYEDGTRYLSANRTSPSLFLGDYLIDEPFECWYRMVEYYSYRQLTFTTDKLPAISGLASKIHEATNSRYVAGLWTENMPADLIWQRNAFLKPQQVLEYAPTTLTPSWSWASIKGPVDFAHTTRAPRLTVSEYLTEVFNVQCDVTGLNPFGEVSGGSLTLRGPVFTAQLVYDQLFQAENRDDLYLLMGDDDSSGVQVLEPDSYLEESVVRGAENLLVPTVRRSPCPRPQSVDEFNAPVSVFILCNAMDRGEKRRGWWALVLGKSDAVVGAYSRLGIVWIEDRRFWAGKAQQETITIV